MHGRYTTESDWNAWHAVDREAEWGQADLLPLVSFVKAASDRAARDLRIQLGGLRLLELGCGSSGLAAALCAEGFRVFASDFSALGIGRNVAAAPGVEWLVADARRLPMPAASVQVIFAKTLLDCLRAQRSSEGVLLDVLKEAHRVLEPLGRLVLMDKKGDRIHWNIRAPVPVELFPVGVSWQGNPYRRWFCHEFRKRCPRRVANCCDDGRLPPLFPGPQQEGWPVSGLELEDSLGGLIVKSSSDMRFCAGDRVVEINGKRRTADCMRRVLSRSNSVTLIVERQLCPGWLTRSTMKFGPESCTAVAQQSQGVAMIRERRCRGMRR